MTLRDRLIELKGKDVRIDTMGNSDQHYFPVTILNVFDDHIEVKLGDSNPYFLSINAISIIAL